MKTLTTPTQKAVNRLKENSLTSWCVPTDVEPLKNYALEVQTSQNNSRGGNEWEAVLYKNGLPIMSVENRGDGGCNYYHAILGDRNLHRVELAAFEEASEKAYPNRKYEQTDIACSFLDCVANL